MRVRVHSRAEWFTGGATCTERPFSPNAKGKGTACIQESKTRLETSRTEELFRR